MFKPSPFTRLIFHGPLWHCGWGHFPRHFVKKVLTSLLPSSMKNWCSQPMYAIFNTTPFQTRFFSFLTNIRRLTLSAVWTPAPYATCTACYCQSSRSVTQTWLTVSSYRVLGHYSYATNRLRKLKRQDNCDVLPSTSSHVLTLLTLLKFFTSPPEYYYVPQTPLC